MHTIRPKTRSASGFQKINYKNHEFLIFSAYSFLSLASSLGSLPKATGIGMISFKMTEGCLYVKPAAPPGTHRESPLNRLGTIRDAK